MACVTLGAMADPLSVLPGAVGPSSSDLDVSVSSASLLGLSSEVHFKVLMCLDTRDLLSLSSTCTYFSSLLSHGDYAIKLWRQHVFDYLGQGVATLHEAAMQPNQRRSALAWRQLLRAGWELETVRWWKEGTSKLQDSIVLAPPSDHHAPDMERLTAMSTNLMAAERFKCQGQTPPDLLMKSALWSYTSGTFVLGSNMARVGHSCAQIGNCIVVVGGCLRDLSMVCDIIVLRQDTLQITAPVESGERPKPRMRHTCAPVSVPRDSLLEALLLDALGSLEVVHQGSVLALFGGFDSDGHVYGGAQLELLWLDQACARARWLHTITTGDVPLPRYHHSMSAFGGGSKLVVYGGETLQLGGGASGVGSAAYVLDVGSLTWSQHHTLMPAALRAAGLPCTRAMHVAVVRSLEPGGAGGSEAGGEDLVVVGGRDDNDELPLIPCRLDLVTWQWSVPEAYAPALRQHLMQHTSQASPSGLALSQGDDSSLSLTAVPTSTSSAGIIPQPGEGDEPTEAGAGAAVEVYVPPPRQRPAYTVLGHWLILHGGHNSINGQPFHDDIQRLHLPSLTWQAPPTIVGAPTWLATKVAGHTLGGNVAFGGMISGLMGLMPVIKADILLLGLPHDSLGSTVVHSLRSALPHATRAEGPNPTSHSSSSSVGSGGVSSGYACGQDASSSSSSGSSSKYLRTHSMLPSSLTDDMLASSSQAALSSRPFLNSEESIATAASVSSEGGGSAPSVWALSSGSEASGGLPLPHIQEDWCVVQEQQAGPAAESQVASAGEPAEGASLGHTLSAGPSAMAQWLLQQQQRMLPSNVAPPAFPAPLGEVALATPQSAGHASAAAPPAPTAAPCSEPVAGAEQQKGRKACAPGTGTGAGCVSADAVHAFQPVGRPRDDRLANLAHRLQRLTTEGKPLPPVAPPTRTDLSATTSTAVEAGADASQAVIIRTGVLLQQRVQQRAQQRVQERVQERMEEQRRAWSGAESSVSGASLPTAGTISRGSSAGPCSNATSSTYDSHMSLASSIGEAPGLDEDSCLKAGRASVAAELQARSPEQQQVPMVEAVVVSSSAAVQAQGAESGGGGAWALPRGSTRCETVLEEGSAVDADCSDRCSLELLPQLLGTTRGQHTRQGVEGVASWLQAAGEAAGEDVEVVWSLACIRQALGSEPSGVQGSKMAQQQQQQQHQMIAPGGSVGAAATQLPVKPEQQQGVQQQLDRTVAVADSQRLLWQSLLLSALAVLLVSWICRGFVVSA